MRTRENIKSESNRDGYGGVQSHWGETILAEATSKGPVLFSGTDWVVVPLDSLSPARRAIIHPISQRLAGVENTALVDGLFGRIWEFPKCENVRERKVTRGDQFVGDSRIDFQWNKTERTLCRVCGKHILKQKFATEHYQRSPTCWRLVMRHIGILDLDSNTSNSNTGNTNKNSYQIDDNLNYNSIQKISLDKHSGVSYTRNSFQNEKNESNCYLSNTNQGGDGSNFIDSNMNNNYTCSNLIPTSNVDYILQNKSMNLFRAATKHVYEELIKYKGSSNEHNIYAGFNSVNNDRDVKFDSTIVENVMSESKGDISSDSNVNNTDEPYLLISSVLPNVFPSISHRPLPVNVCYIKLTFNWPGARLVRDLWALDCELLVDWGDGVLTQARRFTLKELGELPESDSEMRNIYSQGFAYLKCFVPHKPPGRADLKIRIPKSLWEYWEAFANDKNNTVTFHNPEIFASNLPQNCVIDAGSDNFKINNNNTTNWNNNQQYRDPSIQRSHPYSPSIKNRPSPSPSPRSIGNKNSLNLHTNSPLVEN